MGNFEDIFETCKRSCISVFSICVTVILIFIFIFFSTQPTKKKLKPISDTSVNQSSTVSPQNNNSNKKPFKDLVKQEAGSSQSENTVSVESQIVEKRRNNTNRKKVKGTASREITKSKESRKEGSASSKSVCRSSSDSAVLEPATPIDKIQRLKSDSDILPKSSKKRKRKEVLFYSPKRLRSSSSISKEETHSSSTAAKTGSRNSRLRSPRGGSSSSAQSSSNLGSCASSR